MGSSRRKGHTWERDVARMFREIYGEQVHRGQQSRTGSDDADVEGTPYWIECKVGAQPRLLAALDQAIEAQQQANDERMPLVIAKKDRCVPTVTLRLSDFLELVKGREEES